MIQGLYLSRRSAESPVLWQPEGVTREEFFRCFGLPCDEMVEVERKLKKLEKILSGNVSLLYINLLTVKSEIDMYTCNITLSRKRV